MFMKEMLPVSDQSYIFLMESLFDICFSIVYLDEHFILFLSQ